jgi:hypothetical protein
MAVLSKVQQVIGAGAVCTALVYVISTAWGPSKSKSSLVVDLVDSKKDAKKKKKSKEKVDIVFVQRLVKLIKIAVPSWKSKSVAYLGILGFFLVIRTVLSIRISEVNGSIVRAIVQRDYPMFLRRIAILAVISIPASTVNSMLKYLDNLVTLSLKSEADCCLDCSRV